MSLLTFAMVLASAAMHATWNAMLKSSKGLSVVFIMSVVSAVVGLIGVFVFEPIANDSFPGFS